MTNIHWFATNFRKAGTSEYMEFINRLDLFAQMYMKTTTYGNDINIIYPVINGKNMVTTNFSTNYNTNYNETSINNKIMCDFHW